MAKKKKKRAAPKPPTIQRPKEFLDLIAPGAIQFNTDNFVFGNTDRARGGEVQHRSLHPWQPVSHGDDTEKLPAHDG